MFECSVARSMICVSLWGLRSSTSWARQDCLLSPSPANCITQQVTVTWQPQSATFTKKKQNVILLFTDLSAAYAVLQWKLWEHKKCSSQSVLFIQNKYASSPTLHFAKSSSLTQDLEKSCSSLTTRINRMLCIIRQKARTCCDSSTSK